MQSTAETPSFTLRIKNLCLRKYWWVFNSFDRAFGNTVSLKNHTLVYFQRTNNSNNNYWAPPISIIKQIHRTPASPCFIPVWSQNTIAEPDVVSKESMILLFSQGKRNEFKSQKETCTWGWDWLKLVQLGGTYSKNFAPRFQDGASFFLSTYSMRILA